MTEQTVGVVHGLTADMDRAAEKVEVPQLREAVIFATRTKNRKKSEEKVLAFSIDDTDYYIDKHVPLTVSLRYLEYVRKYGVNYAVSWVVEEVLGEEAYQAMLDYPELTRDQWKSVCAYVVEHTLGSEEDEDPKSEGEQSG